MNASNTVIYTGVTSNIIKRVYEHKEKKIEGFTSKYKVDKLVYYEIFDNINDAIKREKQIKKSSRKNKLGLINKTNPNKKDIYTEILN